MNDDPAAGTPFGATLEGIREFDDPREETRGEPHAETSSVRSQLYYERKIDAAKVTKDLDVNPFRHKGKLVARYRLLDLQGEGKEIHARVSRNYASPDDRAYYGALDTLIAACVGMYFRDPETGHLTLIDEDDLGPMGYDTRLAQYLGLQTEKARDTLLAVWDGQGTPLLAHVRELNEWMEHPTLQDGLGES